MSTYTVINGNDSGAGSLRDAITLANGNPGSTIIFDVSVTQVQLTSGTLTISANMTIIGNGIINTEITRTAGIFGIFTITTGNVDISNLTISNGDNTGSLGGGIAGTTANITLEYVVLRNNIADRGGGIRIDNSSLIMNYCTLSNNSSGLFGGGMSIENSSTVDIFYCTFNGNSTTSFGGGIYNGFSNINMKYSTISNNNLAAFGAGAMLDNSTFYSFDNTIAQNSASSFGGGIYAASTTLTLINTTICYNNAINGGGININNSIFNINNTLIAKNTATLNPDVNVSSPPASSNNNLIGIDDSGTFVNGVNGNKVGSSVTPLDPQIGTLQNNGGPTETIALTRGSEAVNAGNNIYVPIGELYDQRGIGYLRIVHGIVDIGAYEYQGIICYSGESMILVKDILTGEISEIEAKNVRSNFHLVLDTQNNRFIPIKLNIITGPTDRFMLIKKDSLGLNKPTSDFYVTGGHRIVIDNQEIKARDVSCAIRVRVNSQNVYSICTEYRCPIRVNGIDVISWGYNDWINYANQNGINWIDNGKNN